jgi:hypothetical protein
MSRFAEHVPTSSPMTGRGLVPAGWRGAAPGQTEPAVLTTSPLVDYSPTAGGMLPQGFRKIAGTTNSIHLPSQPEPRNSWRKNRCTTRKARMTGAVAVTAPARRSGKF